MISSAELCALIEKGGVYTDVEGKTPAELYKSLSELIKVPSGCTKELVCEELTAREQILSTAVGNGISIPHPRKPIIQNDDEQQIIVCFPKKAIEMSAQDAQRVFVMFVILSKTTSFHLELLSSLAKLLSDEEFRRFLAKKPSLGDLTERISSANM